MKPETTSQVLRDQQKTILGLIIQAENTELRTREMEEGVLRELGLMLGAYVTLEEEFIRPALESRPELSEVLGDSWEELKRLKYLAKTLASSNIHLREPSPAELEPRSAILKEPRLENPRLSEIFDLFTRHREIEERDFFPRFDEKLEALGPTLLARRGELLQGLTYDDPNGGEQKRRTA